MITQSVTALNPSGLCVQKFGWGGGSYICHHQSYSYIVGLVTYWAITRRGPSHHHLHQNQNYVCSGQVYMTNIIVTWSMTISLVRRRSCMDIINKYLLHLWIMWPIIRVFLRGNFHLSDNIFQDLIWKLSNNLSCVIWEIARQSLGIKLCSKAHEPPTVWSNKWKMIVHKFDVSSNILIINKHVNNATKNLTILIF